MPSEVESEDVEVPEDEERPGVEGVGRVVSEVELLVVASEGMTAGGAPTLFPTPRRRLLAVGEPMRVLRSWLVRSSTLWSWPCSRGLTLRALNATAEVEGAKDADAEAAAPSTPAEAVEEVRLIR